MAGTFFDQNGVEHALTPETQPMADALGAVPSRFDTGAPPINNSFGVDPNALPPLTPPPAAPFVGTPSQAPAGFSGVSPATSFPAIPGAGATGTWDVAPATTSAALPATTQNSSGLEVVEGNGAKPSPAATTSTGTPTPTGPGTYSQTETVYSGMTARGRSILDKAETAQLQALDKQAEAAKATYTAEEAAAKAKETAANSFRLQEEAKQAEVEKAKIEWDDRIKSADDKYRGANIDSGRLWRDSSTGSKIAAGIGIMMGALGQALTGKDNAALKIIDAAIDRDIDVQKANMEKAGKEAQMTRSAYSTYLEATGSEAAARNRIKMLALEEIGAKFDAAAAANKSPEMAAAAMKAKADLSARYAELKAKDETFKSTTVTKPIEVSTKAPVAQYEQAVDTALSPLKQSVIGFQQLKDTFKDPEVRSVSGPIIGYYEKAKGKLGFKQDPAWIRADTQAGIVQRALLKQMSGSGVSEGERELYREAMGRIDQDPDNALAITEQFLQSKKDEYNRVRGEQLSRYGGANPAIESAYPVLSDSGDKKDKYSFGTPTK